MFSSVTGLPSTTSAASVSTGFVQPLRRCRVGGGALARWPPSAAQTVRAVFPHTAFTKTHASEMQSKGSTESSSPARTRRTAWFRQLSPATVPPTLESMRPNAPRDPAIEPVEELSDVGSLVVMTPPSQHRIQFLNQLPGLERNASPGKRAYLIHEMADRFLPRDSIQFPRLSTTANLARRQPELLAALDFVPKKLESLPDMHDPRLLRMQLHAQFI